MFRTHGVLVLIFPHCIGLGLVLVLVLVILVASWTDNRAGDGDLDKIEVMKPLFAGLKGGWSVGHVCLSPRSACVL
jgi:hypothetical protein